MTFAEASITDSLTDEFLCPPVALQAGQQPVVVSRQRSSQHSLSGSTVSPGTTQVSTNFLNFPIFP